MTIHAVCRAFAPESLCQHGDLLLYLAPSAALAVLIRMLVGTHPVFFLFTVAGTLCHELAHFIVGLLTFAQPSSFTVIPRRRGRDWQLGSVSLARVRWYNAAPTALAPVLIILIPIGVAWWRTRPGWHFQPIDLAIAFLLAPQFLRCWPSREDWRIAMYSWPYVPVIAMAYIMFQFVNQ